MATGMVQSHKNPLCRLFPDLQIHASNCINLYNIKTKTGVQNPLKKTGRILKSHMSKKIIRLE